MSAPRRILLATLAAPLVAFGVVTAVWAIERPAAGEVAPGVVVGEHDLSGADSTRVREVVRTEAADFATTPVRITTPDFHLDTTAGALGLTVDQGRTVAAVLRAGRNDPGPLAPLRYARTWFADRTVPLRLRLDEVAATDELDRIEGSHRVAVEEPRLDTSGDAIALVAGVDGRALDVADLVGHLPRTAAAAGERIELEARQRVTEPTVDDATAQTLVDRANAATTDAIAVTIGGRTVEIDRAAFRRGFSLDTSTASPHLVVDPSIVEQVLAAQSGISVANPTGVRFDLVGGVPTPVAGTDAAACCGDAAPRQLADALVDGAKSVTLATRTVTAAEGVQWAAGLGVKEVIGEFTTRHPCCAPRVRNIHRISDLTRGVVIAPGETFSVNGFVGRRTVEKGFVSAPVIEQGEFKEDIGGGVSQFATTLFNASFFGGLDIPEHKAHSIYISRYPFGREATLAYPSVDLKVHNNTPYGVMIWPTYTDTSITIQLWSTRFAAGTQTSINKTGGCGYVRLTRTRMFVSDGHTETDDFTASYDCDPPKH